jgi:hypothetical protein
MCLALLEYFSGWGKPLEFPLSSPSPRGIFTNNWGIYTRVMFTLLLFLYIWLYRSTDIERKKLLYQLLKPRSSELLNPPLLYALILESATFRTLEGSSF